MITRKLIRKFPFFLLLIALSVSCREKKNAPRLVTVSILPQKYFVERIAGDYVEVNVMVPPGMNPATCDLSTGQLKKLYESDLCFAVGYLPFETTHLYPALKSRKDIPLIRHSDRLELIEDSCHHSGEQAPTHEGGIDPHVWLSPSYARQICREIFRTLAEKYPEKQTDFAANHASLQQDIERIAFQADSLLSSKAHKTFLIYHPALTYFARDYGMEQIPIENEGKEPNPAHMKKIMDTVRGKNIHLVFIQNQFDVSNAESIARETGCRVIPIDPLSENWLTEMENLLQIFSENLK